MLCGRLRCITWDRKRESRQNLCILEKSLQTHPLAVRARGCDPGSCTHKLEWVCLFGKPLFAWLQRETKRKHPIWGCPCVETPILGMTGCPYFETAPMVGLEQRSLRNLIQRDRAGLTQDCACPKPGQQQTQVPTCDARQATRQEHLREVAINQKPQVVIIVWTPGGNKGTPSFPAPNQFVDLLFAWLMGPKNRAGLKIGSPIGKQPAFRSPIRF